MQRFHKLECNLRYLLDIARDFGGNLEVSNIERRYLRVHSPHHLGFNVKRVVLYIEDKEYAKLRSKLILIGKTVSGWFRELVNDFLNK